MIRVLKKTSTVLFLLLLAAMFFRFFNLSWGAPFFFHPDERNIASAITQLSFPNQMNPHFFAYGGFSLYLTYFIGLLIAFPLHHSTAVSFESALLIGRYISALLSTLLIYCIFLAGKKLQDEKTGLLAAFLSVISVGLIQYAHFSTVETMLTFFSVLFFIPSLNLLHRFSWRNVIILGFVSGILVATKVSTVIMIPMGVLVILLANLPHEKKRQVVLEKLAASGTFLILTTVIFILTNPFVFLDFHSFMGSMQYESGVSLGTLHVFYTGEFFNKIPIIFQFLHSYPFLLNPLITILFIPSFFVVLIQGIKKRNSSFLLLIAFFLVLFLSQAFLFAKWTRYILPTIPFMILITALFFEDSNRLLSKLHLKLTSLFLQSTICVISSVFLVSFFITVYVHPDTRIQATSWATIHLPKDANILSESYDMGIVPFNEPFSHISLYNFYDLDTQEVFPPVPAHDYMILPSQRLLKTRLLDKKDFPKAYVFYQNLRDATGYKKIYETPCDIFCTITYMGSPVFSYEETVNVFDRPTIMIFQHEK